MTLNRREFVRSVTSGSLAVALSQGSICAGDAPSSVARGVSLPAVNPQDDLFSYIKNANPNFDSTLFRQLLGAANEFKEGDQSISVGAADDASRTNARRLIANARLSDFKAHPVFDDKLNRLLADSRDHSGDMKFNRWTMADLKCFLLEKPEREIKVIMPRLSSDVIGCIVKLMSNEELIVVGRKVFNPLPHSNIGAEGYLGARIQPNSPTDNTDDIRWQVFDGWSYAVGDVLLGTNPVSSEPASVEAVELTLKDLLVTFQLEQVLPHCVLSHIDVQAEVERQRPGSTALWFQSIAGSDDANATFDISLEKMLEYASMRSGQFGLYFETGQGADFTNGHAHGFDMVLHEARKYGFARVLSQRVAAVQEKAGRQPAPWVHVNDVAGFIGPEVFRTREQLVRCCLEDIVMGKLHGLTIGLDVCSTLHMDISLADLDWCLDQILPANPAYLMALPTKIDPMLGYLTTGFQDHVRLREKFAYRVDDRMQEFFRQLQVVDEKGRPTEHFGDPVWVYLQFQRRKGDARSDAEIREEGQKQINEVRSRGVFIAEGYGRKPWELKPKLAADVQHIYDDAKKSIWMELEPEFIATVPDLYQLATQSTTREDYILHPPTGEQLSPRSVAALADLRRSHEGRFDVQIVISDGLNALAISDKGHLEPFLEELRNELANAGLTPANENLVITSGRVRAGYRIGERLFAGLAGQRAILHIIGERPGTGHHTFSVYITAPDGSVWSKAGQVDHNITKVVSGIAVTALAPREAAKATVKVLQTIDS